jgi:DNA-3-methyladenine glycosylase
VAGQQDRPPVLTDHVPHGVADSSWRDVLDRPAEDVAPRLLGAVLRHRTAHGVVAVRLTEVEAYAGEGADPGSHAFRGPGRRNATMFGPSGRLYVYFTYGMHWCANVVCGPPGRGSAVLLRAGELIEGLALARQRRAGARRDADLARGPARLTTALGIDGSHDGADLDPHRPAVLPDTRAESPDTRAESPDTRAESPDTRAESPDPRAVSPESTCDGAGGVVRVDVLTLELADRPVPAGLIACGPRVGVSGPGGDGVAFPWRFWISGDPTVSVYRPGRSARRSAR